MTLAELPLRILPQQVIAARRPQRMLERMWVVNRSGAWTATREQESSFSTIQRFLITPLFLFGGAFYPIEQLPGWLQTIAKITPIWHGVELCRNAVNGRLEWDSTIVHVGYLWLFALVGWLLASRTFARRLGK